MLTPPSSSGKRRDRLPDPLVGQCHDIWKGGIGQGVGRGVRHRSGDVADRVVHDVVDRVDRIFVCRLAAGRKAPSLVDGDVDQHRPRAHLPAPSSSVTSLGAEAPGTSTVPMTRSASRTSCSMVSRFEAIVTSRPW